MTAGASVGTVDITTVPRDINYLRNEVKPSVRFRLMNQLNAFTDQNDKIAYSNATADDQTQRLLQMLQAFDAGGGVPMQQMQMPVQQMQPMQQPMQPMMQPMQPPPMQQLPQQQMQPMVQAAWQPQQPIAQQMQPAWPQQVQQPMQPMQPMQPVQPMQQQPMRSAAPAAPMTRVMPGVANAGQPAPMQAAPGNSGQVHENQMHGAPIDPLSLIVANQQSLSENLQRISRSLESIALAVDVMQLRVSRSDHMQSINFLLLFKFMERGLTMPKPQALGILQEAITNGELQQLEQFLQLLGGQQG